MEIRIENTIPIDEIEKLKAHLDEFFNCDFNTIVEGTYTYFRDA